MSTPTKAKQWVLNKKPTGMATTEGPNATFQQKEIDLPSVGDGELLVKTLYLSNDPAQRGWIRKDADPERLYVPPVKEGEVMRSRAIAKVLHSKASNVREGALVTASTGWADYAVVAAKDCQVLEELPGLSITHWLGALGLTGLTAYYGIVDIAGAKPSDSVVVSGAAGATGSMVVQIAKHLLNCQRVIGIAGSDEKCRWVEKLGADVCLNYKSSSFEEDLTKATTPFVDVYFDNVGGPILDLMLGRLARNGRIAACGSISNYNDQNVGLKNFFQIVTQRIKVQGFIVLDNMQNVPKIVQTFQKAVKEGKLRLGAEHETVVQSNFEQIPQTWNKLFEGTNQGKLVTALT